MPDASTLCNGGAKGQMEVSEWFYFFSSLLQENAYNTKHWLTSAVAAKSGTNMAAGFSEVTSLEPMSLQILLNNQDLFDRRGRHFG